VVITREAIIKITESNFTYYEDLGYDITFGDEIKIPIELLSIGSHYKILCKCDGCGIEKWVLFKNYVKYDNQWGFYHCRKCSEPKRKRKLRERWGVDYPIQNKEIREKRISTMNYTSAKD
jgi:hypothetical protein